MPVSRLLREHFRDVLKLEADTARRLLGLYRVITNKTAARLAELDAAGTDRSFTAQHLALTMVQMRDAMRRLGAGLTERLERGYRRTLDVGGRQQLAEIADLERRFGGSQPGRLAGLSLAGRAEAITKSSPWARSPTAWSLRPCSSPAPAGVAPTRPDTPTIGAGSCPTPSAGRTRPAGARQLRVRRRRAKPRGRTRLGAPAVAMGKVVCFLGAMKTVAQDMRPTQQAPRVADFGSQLPLPFPDAQAQ